jgi:hypothetical protein
MPGSADAVGTRTELLDLAETEGMAAVCAWLGGLCGRRLARRRDESDDPT